MLGLYHLQDVLLCVCYHCFVHLTRTKYTYDTETKLEKSLSEYNLQVIC